MHDDAVPSRAPRWPLFVLLAIAAGGLWFRLVSLTGPGGPLDTPGGYDDSVYFSASALLFRGVLPYRDFVFVHPPGLLYFYGLVSAWRFDPASLFAAARVFATVVGAVNIFLVGRIVARAASPFAGFVAAVSYAIYPEAISAERGPYLEAVLNLACLSLALAWLRRAPNAMLAGALCGAACAVKVLGGIWFLAAIVFVPDHRSRKRFFLAAAITGFVLLVPLALLNLRELVMDTLLFHIRRPPDGYGPGLPRLREMLIGTHVLTSILALVSIALMKTREVRFFLAVYVLTIATLLASSTYWPEYNAHLAASQCILAGFGAHALLRLAGKRQLVAGAAIAIAIYALNKEPLHVLYLNSHTRAPEILAAGAAIRELVPPHDCVFSFDPSWSLAGGRLPAHGDGAPVIVDAYGAQLVAALRDGTRFPDAGAAFRTPASQRDLRARLAACRFAILGDRGEWQMSAETRAWFDAHATCRAPQAGKLCLWQITNHPSGR